MTFQPGSIRFRVTAIAVVTSAAVVLAFGWLFIELLTNRLVDAGQEDLAEITADVEGLSLVELGESDAQYQLESGDYFLFLELNDDGDVFVNLQPADDPSGDSVGGFVIDSGTGELREVIEEDPSLTGDELLEIAVEGTEQIRDLAGDVGGGRLELLQTTNDVITDISDGVDAARSAALVVGPLLVLVSGLSTWLLVGRALAPTRRIAAEAAAIGTDTLDQRVSLRGAQDEVDTIATVINEMLDRIEGGLRREQQFVADASHELKTPITTARMAAELAADDAPESAYPPQVVEELDRMQALIDDLLHLARDPEGRPLEYVSLDELVARTVAEHPAVDRITVSVASSVVLQGRAPDLRRALINLIDNAARYAERSIAVDLSTEGRMAVLTVDDDGPGIAPDDRDQVFDRFVRLDEGRARDAGGSGLGLAITREIAARHGGSIHVTDSPLGGARFVMTLAGAG